MVNFADMPTRYRMNCQQCGDIFRGLANETKCQQCKLYEEHPELAPRYWSWHKNGQEWKVICTWPEDEPLPGPGEVIAVHRKDGSTSFEIISETEGLMWRPNGEAKLTCRVMQ